MSHADRWLLEKAELFQALDRPALDAVLSGAGARPVAAGATLLEQGDQPDHLFIVAQGRFKMTTLSEEGVQKTLRFMEPGDVIGCAAVFRRIAYPATATATIDSVVLAWTAAQFERLLRCYPQLAANALAVVGGRAEQMLQRLREFTTETVEQRIARILVRFAKQSGSKPDRQRELVLKISRQDLAELSDTTMFTASRVISAWSRAGIVEGGRGSIRLVDLKRLSQIAAPKTASYER